MVYNYLSLTHKRYQTSIFNSSLNRIDSILQSYSTEFGFITLSWYKITDVEIKNDQENLV